MPSFVLYFFRGENMNVNELLDKLFEVKEKRRFKFYELAKMFHVDIKTIQRWRKKESVPRQVYIPMIEKLVESEEKYSEQFKKE